MAALLLRPTLVRELHEALTYRQGKILMYIGQGMTYQEIAARMYVSERTVRREVSRMKELVDAATLPVLLVRLG
jgi:DNA-binding CsgD family transcriptional regulator